MEVPRILAIDYGEKRIGIATSDGLGLGAHPKPYIPNNTQTIPSILALITEFDIATILLGLPKNQEGGESEKSLEVRAFAEQLSQKTPLPIVFWDERFSTIAVEKQLINANVKRKKRKELIDSQAACFILQGYLDRLRFNQ